MIAYNSSETDAKWFY